MYLFGLKKSVIALLMLILNFFSFYLYFKFFFNKWKEVNSNILLLVSIVLLIFFITA